MVFFQGSGGGAPCWKSCRRRAAVFRPTAGASSWSRTSCRRFIKTSSNSRMSSTVHGEGFWSLPLGDLLLLTVSLLTVVILPVQES